MRGGPRRWARNLPAPHHAGSEDASFAGGTPAGDGWWAAVADGVGASPGGREASAAAVAEVERWLGHAAPDGPGLEELFRGVCRRLAAIERSEPALQGLATTLTVLADGPSGLWVAHLGDSRAYRCGVQGVRRLTSDHRVDSGAQSFLTRAVTAAGAHRPQVAGSARPAAGEWFLLCTDGVWSACAPEALDRALAGGPGTAAAFLDALAESRRDDFCCVLLEIPGTPTEPGPDGRRAPTRPLA